MRKFIKTSIIFIVSVIVLGIFSIVIINLIIINTAKKNIFNKDEIKEEYDCIMILGASVLRNGTPSNMLEDRLLRGLELYELGVAKKIIVSGDNGASEKGYDEVNPMKNFLINKGVPSEDIFMDHAGFNTYSSMYRAKNIFKVKKMIVVTQEYHLYRAVYLANKLKIETVGVSSDLRTYVGQEYRDLREIFARVKAFGNGITKPKSKYLGDEIPISGDGDITND